MRIARFSVILGFAMLLGGLAPQAAQAQRFRWSNGANAYTYTPGQGATFYNPNALQVVPGSMVFSNTPGSYTLAPGYTSLYTGPVVANYTFTPATNNGTYSLALPAFTPQYNYVPPGNGNYSTNPSNYVAPSYTGYYYNYVPAYTPYAPADYVPAYSGYYYPPGY